MKLERRAMTALEAEAQNARIPSELSDYVRFQEGQLVCDGLRCESLDLGTIGSLTVLGDATIEGLVSVDATQLLCVTGKLTAPRGIVADGNVFVLGDLDTGDVVGDSMSNRVFGCAGDANVRCLLEKGHEFVFEGNVTGQCVACLSNVVRVRKDKRIDVKHAYIGFMSDEERHALLAPELFDESGNLKTPLVVKRMEAGLPLLK